MLDMKWIRENPEAAKKGLLSKRAKNDVDALLQLDQERRTLLQETEGLKQDRNSWSKQVSDLKREGKDGGDLIEKTREIGQAIRECDERLKVVEEELADQLDRLPNLPHHSVPHGPDETHNVEVKQCGKKRAFDFKPADHMELGERLGLFDFPRGSKISGRGFPVYTGAGARLERSMINFMLDLHSGEHGFREIFPPFVVNRASMRGTGQLPKMEEDMYYSDKDELFLIPTAEVPVTNLHRDELLSATELPLNYCAYTACFRREAGSWGKDTRGFLRLHQFNKVELVKFVDPETSYQELETLLGNACRVLDILGLHYRVIELCSGDLSFAAAKCYDIEVWSPAEEKWLECSSCSNFEDFQARRMNIRFRRDANARPEFVHTLNGSGLATPRLLVALLENYQQQDGSVLIPEALRQYTGFAELKPAQ